MNVIDRFGWMDRSACVVARLDTLPEPGAWPICQACPTVTECLAWHDEARSISTISLGRRRADACGEPRGYARHRRRGEDACESCLIAHARAKAEREGRRR